MGVATKLFAKWGYNATTTAAIADAAGVTEPILYRHFSNKQDLFVAITRAMSEQTLQYWRQMIEGAPGATEKIRAIARGFPAHIRKLEDAYHVLHGAGDQPGPESAGGHPGTLFGDRKIFQRDHLAGPVSGGIPARHGSENSDLGIN